MLRFLHLTGLLFAAANALRNLSPELIMYLETLKPGFKAGEESALLDPSNGITWEMFLDKFGFLNNKESWFKRTFNAVDQDPKDGMIKLHEYMMTLLPLIKSEITEKRTHRTCWDAEWGSDQFYDSLGRLQHHGMMNHNMDGHGGHGGHGNHNHFHHGFGGWGFDLDFNCEPELVELLGAWETVEECEKILNAITPTPTSDPTESPTPTPTAKPTEPSAEAAAKFARDFDHAHDDYDPHHLTRRGWWDLLVSKRDFTADWTTTKRDWCCRIEGLGCDHDAPASSYVEKKGCCKGTLLKKKKTKGCDASCCEAMCEKNEKCSGFQHSTRIKNGKTKDFCTLFSSVTKVKKKCPTNKKKAGKLSVCHVKSQ